MYVDHPPGGPTIYRGWGISPETVAGRAYDPGDTLIRRALTPDPAYAPMVGGYLVRWGHCGYPDAETVEWFTDVRAIDLESTPPLTLGHPERGKSVQTLGLFAGFTVDPIGLYCRWGLHDDVPDSARAILADEHGEPLALSIGFVPLTEPVVHGRSDGRRYVQQTRVRVHHAAITDRPAYPGTHLAPLALV